MITPLILLAAWLSVARQPLPAAEAPLCASPAAALPDGRVSAVPLHSLTSLRRLVAGLSAADVVNAPAERTGRLAEISLLGQALLQEEVDDLCAPREQPSAPVTKDRKSTRLNSSH